MLRSLLLICACILCSELAAESKIDYLRDVQPILAEHCFHCHGADDAARQGGLRLDLQDSAHRGGDSGEPAIVPAATDQGTLLARISSDQADSVMPPPETQKPLSADQKETLRRWISEGGGYAGHWAFAAPQKTALELAAGENPIDALVAKTLQRAGLTPSPRETIQRLCRRLYMDLVGLPPTIEQLEAFERDGLEKTLADLLASPRYGEKWARHWLDAARYSDTNGYEKDLPRDQWVWRDWVVGAFNRDLPYDQFIIEQIAGDLLPGATQEQIIATGFLRNSMLNEEGAIVPEQFRMFEIFDRIDCIGKAVMGITTQCAQCHTHKYDPLSHNEYFGLVAYINNAYEAQSWVYDEAQLAQRDKVFSEIDAIESQMKANRAGWEAELDSFAQALVAQSSHWVPLRFHQLEAISGLNHPVQQADDSILMLGHTSNDIFFVGDGELQGATGIRLEVLTHQDLPFAGPGRNKVGGWDVQELEILLQRPGTDAWEKQVLVHPSADYSQPEQKLEDGKKSVGPVANLIDGKDENIWKADRGRGRRNQSSVAVVQFEKPLEAPLGTKIKVVMRMGEMVGCCRVSITRQPSPVAQPVDYDAVLAASIPEATRSSAAQRALFAAWSRSIPEFTESVGQIEALWQQYPDATTSVLHLAERPASDSRTTHLLERGEWDRPQHPVGPGVPAAFHARDEDLPNDRLTFARWLVDRKSPLAARVAVNRVWQAIFGEGLVATAEDFGTRSPVPEHLELLDWLAVDFMENGWSHKALIRTIVTSQTYQQTSSVSSEQLQADPRNRLLARGPRFRADAEVVRDCVLSISGLLHHRLGGPGVIPPVPQNVLDYNYTYPSYWTAATGPERYRRAVYAFRKRSMPDPALSSFDAPNSDFACVRRVRSNTPLAALTGLNEVIFVEAAQAFALRILREGGTSDASRAEFAFRCCTARVPTADELSEILRVLSVQRQRLAEGWLNPREITSGDPGKLPELPPDTTPQDAAAWTLTGRVLLNLDETLSKN